MNLSTDEILEVLKFAIREEQKAFMTYFKASKQVEAPELKGILNNLSEEERKHKIILLNEYNYVKKYGLNKDKKSGKVKTTEIKFRLSKNYNLKSLQSISEVDLAGISLPTEIIGGDYLDTFPIKGKGIVEDKLGVILYDTMGHGLSATYIKSVTRRVFQDFREKLQKGRKNATFNPSDIVSTINNKIADKCQKIGAFITLFYCVIDPVEKALTYTTAGHEPPVYFNKETGEVEQLLSTQIIAGFDDNYKYEESVIKFNPGDILVLFTDGITEANNNKDEMFGSNRIPEIVKKHNKKSSSLILDKIMEALRDYVGRKFIRDEVSLFVAKLN